MSVSPDFRDLFAALNAAHAAFLIIRGYFLAVHGTPRFGKDLPAWVKASAWVPLGLTTGFFHGNKTL